MTKRSNSTTLQAKDTKTKETKPKPRRGPPCPMTEAVQLEICARISEGETLTKVCKDPRMPNRNTVTKFAAGSGPENTQFAGRYALARDRLLDVYAEEIITISDDGTTDYIIKTGRNGHEYMAVDQEHIQRSRLRVDSRRWLLSKLRPNEYGDKVVTEVSGSIDHKHDIASLSEREKMRRLALFMVEDQRQPSPPIDGQAVEVSSPLKELNSTDAIPASKPEENQ